MLHPFLVFFLFGQPKIGLPLLSGLAAIAATFTSTTTYYTGHSTDIFIAPAASAPGPAATSSHAPFFAGALGHAAVL